MAIPLIETKLFPPRLRRSLVDRPRLTSSLSPALDARLTLISAPAGFGKTTLLTAWLAGNGTEARPIRAGRSVAWLSLEESDAPPKIFWTYVITALQRALPGVGAGVLPLLQSGGAPVETILATVVNELAGAPIDIDMVLDDYHLVDGPDLRAGMAFLLEHLPPQVHLVICTRTDPVLPLARLRARGQLVEVRAADLRFTSAETAAYFNDVVGLNLSAANIASLEGRTEGWIAALQLAALSVQGRDDVSGFIAGFAGDDRFIVDYLVEEVLDRQTAPVRDFLLSTCLLDRLTGSLCDAVTGEHGGRTTLEALDRANLFVVQLDDNRQWYRYHHLFADVLRAHLRVERPGEISDLHRRASQWYDRHGEPQPAVRHALAAGDADRAADLVELAIPALTRDRQEATIRGWLDRIPDDVVRFRPVLAIGFVGALMAGNEFAGVEERLRGAERWLEPADQPEMVVVDRPGLARLPGAIQMYRAALALLRGDVSATHRHAGLAAERAADGDHLVRAAASALSGLASWGSGDLDAAHRGYAASVDGLRRAGHLSDVLGCSITLADIRRTQGRLTDARQTLEQALEQALELAGANGKVPLRGTADMHVGLSQIALERGDLAAATEQLQRGVELGEHNGLPQNPYRRRVALAGLREALGDPEDALTLLEEAQRLYVGDYSPDVRPVAASRARVLARQGRVSEAHAWARERGLSVDDDLSYVREFEHITLARVLLARHGSGADPEALSDAGRLLERLLPSARAGGRLGNVIEILVVQALIRYAAGDTPGALPRLQEALTVAEPEGYVQVFAGEGQPMAALLRVVARQTRSEYLRRLLDVCTTADTTGGIAAAPAGQRRLDALVDPLSGRELEVLRLLTTDLDGPDIARRLSVSLNTVRSHTKSIYSKLGVNSRREAVRRAAELTLLSRPRDH